MCRYPIERLLEGCQAIGFPRSLLDIVEADDAEILRDPQTEFEACPVHEADRQQIGHREHAVRTYGVFDCEVGFHSHEWSCS